MRVYAVSDIHTDYPQNMEWLERHCASDTHRGDVLIVAGDVSDDLDKFRRTFELLVTVYNAVFFTIGNHEMWVRRQQRGQYDSLGKLRVLLNICKELDVRTEPAKLGGVWIVPLWSWYHASWDREPDVPGALPIEKVMLDFHACSWHSAPGLSPSGDDSLALHFDAMNDPAFGDALRCISEERAAAAGRRRAGAVQRPAGDAAAGGDCSGQQGLSEEGPVVISFSHFLPLQALLPEKRWLYYPNLAKASGSDRLAARVAALAPHVHVYGHTHFTQDTHIDGVRYVQWPLGYPHESRRRRSTATSSGWEPILLWDVEQGPSAQRSSYWSNYYKENERTPEVTTPASWVTTQ